MQYHVQKNGSCMLLSFAKIWDYHFANEDNILLAAREIISFVGRDISEEGLTLQEIVDVLDLVGGHITEYSDQTVTLKDGTVIHVPLRPLVERVKFARGYWIAVFKMPDGGYHAIPVVEGRTVGLYLTATQQIVERELTVSQDLELCYAWRIAFDENSAYKRDRLGKVHERLALVELTFEDLVGTGLAGQALRPRS